MAYNDSRPFLVDRHASHPNHPRRIVMPKTWLRWAACGLFVLAAGAAGRLPAAEEPAKVGPDPQAYEATVAKAIDYLKTKGQAADGSYSKRIGVGATALITTALLRHGRSPDDPLVSKSLKYLESFLQKDGGIYSPPGDY